MGLLKNVDISFETTVICLVTLQAIYWFILTPISLYYVYAFWKLHNYQQNVPFFTKRHPKLVVISSILSLIYPTAIRGIVDFTSQFEIFPAFHPLTAALLNATSCYMVLISIRLWLLYFDHTSQKNALSLKWKQQILKQNIHIPWTFRHKWLGSVKLLSFIAITLSFSFLFIIVVTATFIGPQSQSYTQLLPFIYLLFCMIIGFKIRKCRDVLMIQKEFKVSCICLLSIILFYVLAVIPWFEVYSNPRNILINICTCSGCYMVSLVPTHWVIQQYNKHTKKQLLLENERSNNAQNYIHNRLTLEQILTTKDGFDLLANHLVNEFSIENLFFIFEIQQIKNELINHQLIDRKDVGVMIDIDYERIDNFRRKDSYIYSIKEMKNNLKYIIKQYIDEYAEFSVNISALTRITLLNNYENIKQLKPINDEIEFKIMAIEMVNTKSISHNDDIMNIEQDMEDGELIKIYISIFDDAMTEIISLIRHDSLPRFYETKSYQTMTDNVS